MPVYEANTCIAKYWGCGLSSLGLDAGDGNDNDNMKSDEGSSVTEYTHQRPPLKGKDGRDYLKLQHYMFCYIHYKKKITESNMPIAGNEFAVKELWIKYLCSKALS